MIQLKPNTARLNEVDIGCHFLDVGFIALPKILQKQPPNLFSEADDVAPVELKLLACLRKLSSCQLVIVYL